MPKYAHKPSKRKIRGWALGGALGLLMAVLVTAGWAGYRMLDPGMAMEGKSRTCYSTGVSESTVGAITTPTLQVKPGQKMLVESIELIDPQNFQLIGTGIQDRVGGIGIEQYLEPTRSSDEWLAWANRATLPAPMVGGRQATPIIALEPITVCAAASSAGVRYVYRNQWNLKYSMDVAYGLEAKPDCLLEEVDQ